ncbi:MAG: hypothetical protein JJ863_34670 [Deltaproteobacteria bacterium]|nr:hypothetical protein [Deltaproteobacteria bacterium]
MTKAYPLQAARELRDRAVDDAAAALAEVVRVHEEASATLAKAEAVLATHDGEAKAFEAREAERGPSSAAVFQQVQHYREARALAREQLRGAVEAARLVVAQRAAAVTEARDALATARAEAEAVGRHEERWRDEQKRAAEKKEELEAEDAVQARWREKD